MTARNVSFFVCIYVTVYISIDLCLLHFLFRSSTLEESLKSMSLCPEEDDIPWDNIRDNRDLTVFVSWNPKDRYSTAFCWSSHTRTMHTHAQ